MSVYKTLTLVLVSRIGFEPMTPSLKVNYTTTNSSQIGNNFNYDGRFMNLKAYIFGKIQYGKMDTLWTPKTFLKSVRFFKKK